MAGTISELNGMSGVLVSITFVQEVTNGSSVTQNSEKYFVIKF